MILQKQSGEAALVERLVVLMDGPLSCRICMGIIGLLGESGER